MLDRLAKRLGVEVRDLFIFPDRSELDAKVERLRTKAHRVPAPKRR